MTDSIMKRRSVRNLSRIESTVSAVCDADADADAGGNEVPPNALLSNSNDEEDMQDQFETSLSVTPFSFVDMQPTDICKVSGQNKLAITDARYYVHILDLDTQKVVKVFGRGGYGIGEFASPTSVCTALIHTQLDSTTPELFYFVGDSLSTQKVKVFTSDCTQFAQVGGLGPALGQFRDISSLSCYNPNLPNMHEVLQSTLGCGSTDSVDSAAQPSIANAPTATSNLISLWSAPSDVGQLSDLSILPDWYRGMQNMDDLENMLYDEHFSGNFLLAQRKPYEYIVDANLEGTEALAMEDSNDNVSIGSHSAGQQSNKGALPMESPMQSPVGSPMQNNRHDTAPHTEGAPAEDPNAEKIYDLLYITRSKKLDHVVIKENKNPGMELGFFVSNSVSPTRETFSCIYDLLRAQSKTMRLTLGGDKRQFIYVAVCDQGNYRVQVFRFYWTTSFMYQPELQLAYVVGGVKKQCVELFDPVSVQYSPSGELAVCDGATNKIHLFSPHMDVIKCINVAFVSIADLPVVTNNHSPSKLTATSSALTSVANTSIASPGSSPTKMSAESLRRSGIDYLTYLTESEASMITFTTEEKDPEYRFQLEKKRRKELSAKKAKTERNASMRASQVEEYNAFMKAGEAAALLDGSGTGTGTSMAQAAATAVKVIEAIEPPPMPTLSKGKSGKGGALAITTDDGPGSLMSKYAVSLYPPTTPSAGSRPGGTTEAGADPEAIEKKRRKNNKAPSCVCYTAEGQLAVGYKSGGVYVHLAYEVFAMGKLRRLQVKSLEHIIVNFLGYKDIQALRNCCLYLHNFTKELRLSWRLFPPARTIAVTRVISLFVQWSKIDTEGFVRPVFPLKDDKGCNICPRFLKLECEDNFCKASHRPISYDRSELSRQGAYIIYTDFLHFVSVIFDPKFLWRYELYIEALYYAYGADKTIIVRHDAMKKNETVRAKVPETVRVMYFPAYLEVMTLLEEQHSERNDLHGHKLFFRAARSRYVPKVDYALENIDKRMVIGPYEQYGRALDVPAKRGKGKKLISLKGMENVERSRNTPVKEHCAVFDCHSDKAADLINRLFS